MIKISIEEKSNQPARTIDELERRERQKRSAYGLSLWQLFCILNFLGFVAAVARFLWGRRLEDAIVTFVCIGALAPLAILVYQATVYFWDRWVPRAFHSPVQDVFDSESDEASGNRGT